MANPDDAMMVQAAQQRAIATIERLGFALPAISFPTSIPVPGTAASVITSGVFAPERLGGGAPSGTTFLRGDSQWAANPSITLSGDASGTGTTAITVTLANVVTSGTATKVTYDAKGRVVSGTTLAGSDIPKTLDHTWVTDFDTQVRTSRLDQLAAPTAAVSMNSQALTNLTAPVNPNDAVTKGYVDNALQGLDIKAACVCATTANITLSGLQAIDGYTTVAGDRVLVKSQTAGAQNGIYVAASGAWTRAADFDDISSVLPGSFAFVEKGTTSAGSGWVLSTPPPYTINTTPLTFTQFSGGGTYTAGTGLTLTGTQFSISSGYAGQASITTLGTVTTGAIDGGTF